MYAWMCWYTLDLCKYLCRPEGSVSPVTALTYYCELPDLGFVSVDSLLASLITMFHHKLTVFWPCCLIYTWTAFFVSNLENVWTYILFSDFSFISWIIVWRSIFKCSALGFLHQSIVYCKICIPFKRGAFLSHCCCWTLPTSVPSAVNFN